MVNARNKGNTFENKCCRLLEEALGLGLHGFGRNPRSGADRRFPGDIAPVDEAIRDKLNYYIECKNRKGWTLDRVFRGKAETTVWKWWRTAVKEAAQYEKCPMLIFTQNNAGIYVLEFAPGYYEGKIQGLLADALVEVTSISIIANDEYNNALWMMPVELWLLYAEREIKAELV